MEDSELEELRKKEEEIGRRIERVEKIEKDLRMRMQRIEKRLGLRVRRGSTKKREGNLREIIREERKALKKTAPKIKHGERKRVLKNKMRDILKRHESPESKKVEKKEGVKEKGRKRLLKKEIGKIVKSGKEKKVEKKPRSELKELKIAVGKDARLLFKVLLKKGEVKLDEAQKELKVDEKTLQEWADDLEEAGIIEVIKHPYGSPELKLRGLDIGKEKIKQHRP